MKFINSILQEATGMLTENSIPVFLFQIFLLIILVVIVKMLHKRKSGEAMEFPMMSIALSLGILIPFVKYSNAVAIVFVGICILLSRVLELKKSEASFVIVGLATALAVASGFWILGVIGWTISMVVLFLSKKD